MRQKWFQDFVVTGVMNSVPLFLSLPGPVGHQAATTSLNTDQMLDGDQARQVKDALEAAVKIVARLGFPARRITYTGNDVSALTMTERLRSELFRR